MDIKQKPNLAQIKKHKIMLSDKNTLTLDNLVSSEKCQQIISESQDFRDRIYTPVKTLLIFIKQVLNSDKSCKNAVADVVAEHLITEGKIVSTNTCSYSNARKRLPEEMINELVKETGQSFGKKHYMNGKYLGDRLKELTVQQSSCRIAKRTKKCIHNRKAKKKE